MCQSDTVCETERVQGNNTELQEIITVNSPTNLVYKVWPYHLSSFLKLNLIYIEYLILYNRRYAYLSVGRFWGITYTELVFLFIFHRHVKKFSFLYYIVNYTIWLTSWCRISITCMLYIHVHSQQHASTKSLLFNKTPLLLK